ncbi:Sugar/inositol transporter [Corchorus olitorius]|uniref:Sugar/inositol transporter n=1 Tax=Corchorus olitorius TaxID=93759 RepID=A0A1R3J6M2_9ROSI|nr:Sugar/inositol transporter [Corchorus olitorius]
MDDFLSKFFHNVYVKKHHARENNYCKFDDEYLQLFTSSLYLAAIVASLGASVFCKKYGRKPTMQVASIFFLVGAILNAAASNLAMLIVGRLLLGAGVGSANQAVPLFISEIAPAKYRGGLNICFQMLITIGILIANIVNYFTSEIKNYGWRYSLGGAAIPAIILLLGSFIIVETPTSLIERGKKEKGLKALRKIRGVDNVQKEFEEIVQATESANRIKHPYMQLTKRRNRPPLISAILLHFFQQFSGINVVMFYAPVLFQTMGFGGSASLLSAVISGSVNVVSTLIAIFSVDRAGRKKLLVLGALIMLVSQCAIGAVLNIYLKSTNKVSESTAILVVILICSFVFSFAWSWGPIGWVVASEIFSLEVRNSGYFFAVATNMLCTFIIAQAFLTMLCHMRAHIFFFFAGWLLLMTIWVLTLLPETKGIPIDEMMERAWGKHWFWKSWCKLPAGDVEKPKELVKVEQQVEIKPAES